MAFKMKGKNAITDAKALRKSNRKLIQELREKFKSGEMSKDEFKAAKKEIKGYTDADSARDHLNI